MNDSFGLIVLPHSEEEVFRTVNDFCESLFDALEAAGGEGGEAEARGVSEELGKALRNMAGLTRRVEKAPDGRTVRIDPAMDLARACGGNRAELVAEVLKRIRLEQRTVTEFRFSGDDRASGLEKLRDLFGRRGRRAARCSSHTRLLRVAPPRGGYVACVGGQQNPHRVALTGFSAFLGQQFAHFFVGEAFDFGQQIRISAGAGHLDLAQLDGLRQFGHREIRAVHHFERELQPQLVLQAREQLHGQQRMAAQVEEIVANAHRADAQHFGPDAAKLAP